MAKFAQDIMERTAGSRMKNAHYDSLFGIDFDVPAQNANAMERARRKQQHFSSLTNDQSVSTK